MAHTKQETAFTGLTNKEVLESREKFGMNLLTPPKRPLCGNFISKSSATR